MDEFSPKVNLLQKCCRTFSDHNLLVASFRTKNRIVDKHEIIMRERKNLDLLSYRAEMEKLDWTALYDSDNVDKINNI